MPEIYIHQTPDVYIRVWEITEPESDFLSGLFDRLHDESRSFDQINERSNRMQYLASRKLIADAFPELTNITLRRKESRQLYIVEHPELYFSISHTEGYAAIIRSNAPCGIDLESVSRDVGRIKHKFVREDESTQFPGIANALRIWSAKECIFKMYGHGEVDFLHHIRIQPGSDDLLLGRFENSIVRFESFITVNQLKNIQLVWGIGINFVEL